MSPFLTRIRSYSKQNHAVDRRYESSSESSSIIVPCIRNVIGIRTYENSCVRYIEEISARKEQINQWFGNLVRIGNLAIQVSRRVYRMCWETNVRLHLRYDSLRVTFRLQRMKRFFPLILLFMNFPDRCIAVNERFADEFVCSDRRTVTVRVHWNYRMQIRQLSSLTSQRNFWIARRWSAEYSSAQQYRN